MTFWSLYQWIQKITFLQLRPVKPTKMDTKGIGRPYPHASSLPRMSCVTMRDSSLLSEPLLTHVLNEGCGMTEMIVLLQQHLISI